MKRTKIHIVTPVLLSLFLLFIVSACSDDTEDAADADSFGGAPVIESVLPQVAVSGGYIYVIGQNLATPAGDVNDVTVKVVPSEDAPAAKLIEDAEVVLEIETGEPTRLTVKVPADMHERFTGAGNVVVTTPEGETSFDAPVFAVKDNGFGGAAAAGQGMVGTIYRLQANTPTLPDMADPCNDPTVVSDDETPCPFTMILVPNFDVPARDFAAGFPGLQSDLVEWFAIHFVGFLNIAEAGSYVFETCSDDGSNLYLTMDGEMMQIVSNDGTHGMRCASGTVDLEVGSYPIVVDYFQGPRYQIGLQVSWTPPSGEKQIIPPEAFRLFTE